MKVEMLGSAEAARRAWPSVPALMVMPFTDPVQAQRSATLLACRAGADGLLAAIHDDRGEGFIRIVNRTFASSDSALFGYLAQDAYPGRDWLRYGVTPFTDPDCHLLAFNDGKWFGAMAGFGLARRSWAQGNYGGELFFSHYRRHYADVELSLLAKEQKALRYAPNSVLLEVDWEKDGKPVDTQDRQLFNVRAKSGFEGRVESPALRQLFA